MAFNWKTLRTIPQILACALVAGCAVHNATIPVALHATRDVNPDPYGQPSPIVVRVYRLAARNTFMVADPIQLVQHDAQTLGKDELGRDEFILQPGDSRQLTIQNKDKKVRFVGLVAAYRAIERDHWRELVPVPADRDLSLDVTAGADGLTVRNVAAK